MFASLLLLACADSDTPTTAKPKFDGYHVDICVVSTYDMSLIVSEQPMITVSQADGFDRLTKPHQYVLKHDDGMQKDHWCAEDITLFAEQDGQALYTGVAPFRNAYTIDKVEVTYQGYMRGGNPAIEEFPYTITRTTTCDNRYCGVIEPKRDETGWWRFNILSVTGNDGIPTAIVDLPNQRQ